MREIKFKAKRVSDGEWVEGSFIYPNEIIPNPSTCDDTDAGIPIIIDPRTICQFTGLQFVEVFYNDILELTYKNKTKRLQVSFSEVHQCLVFLYLDDPKVLDRYTYDKFDKSWWEYNCKNGNIRVIDNIHNK